MKKFLLSTALLTSFAAPAVAADNMDYDALSRLSGVYVGVYGGYGWNDVDGPAGIDTDVDGGDYGVFVGYKADALLDATVNRMGLGINGAIEAHYGWSDADDTFAGVDFEKNNEWGVSFRPGISFLSNQLPYGINPYGIVGYRRAEYEVSVAGVSADEDFNGFELGLGTQLIGYGDFGIRADYTHVWYGEKSDFDPSADELRLGVSYHF